MASTVGRLVWAVGFSVIAAGLVVQAARQAAGRDGGSAAVRIDRLLAAAYPETGPGAAVVVSRGDTVILKKGYGLADAERRVPVTPATGFRLASVSKAFTGTAVLMLAQRGALSLDDVVTKYVPWPLADASAITVRQLLAHASGVADYLDRPDSMQWARREYRVQDLVAAIQERPLAFVPGSRQAYSNSNYVLLGAIVERVVGQPLDRVLDQTVFGPAGMRDTACGRAFDAIPGLAVAYEPTRTPDERLDWSRLVVARPYAASALYAAGGCVSTSEDLARFHRALATGRLLDERWLSESLAPWTLPGGRVGSISAGGWQIDTIGGRRAAMRGGALPGVCTWLLTIPDSGVAVVLLSNRTPGQPRCGALAVQVANLVG